MSYILIVEDEESIADGLRRFLLREGYEVQLQRDFDAVLPAIRKCMPSLIVLDRMLPGGDGIDLCRNIRTFSDVPIILLTAKISEHERIEGLRAGADDYVCKPFSAMELMLRIRMILKRSSDATADSGTQLHLNEHTQTAHFAGQQIDLTKIEFAILSMFSSNPGRIYNRESIMQFIYDDHRVVSDRTVDSHISKLRRKLKALSPEHEMVSAVYGTGYKYEPLK